MTQTIQFRSLVYLSETEKNLNKDKPETEDNMRLPLNGLDNLNELYKTLNKLNYVSQRKNMELKLIKEGLK